MHKNSISSIIEISFQDHQEYFKLLATKKGLGLLLAPVPFQNILWMVCTSPGLKDGQLEKFEFYQFSPWLVYQTVFNNVL